MKILQIGLGRWGQNHLKTFLKLGVELYVVDADPAQLGVASKAGIPAERLSTDYRAFIDRVDGVDVVTPADSHLALCAECFAKGKDVFVEKPIALTSDEAGKMIDLSGERGTLLQVGHIYRYHSASTKIRELIGEGKLGAIQYGYGHFMGFKRPRTDVGVAHTDAIHFFDLFNLLLGERPSAALALVRHYLDLPLEDTSLSALENGRKLVYIEAGYLPPETRRDISIVGDRGSLYCDFAKNALLFYENRHERQGDLRVALAGEAVPVAFEAGEPLKSELEAFLASIRDRRPPLADGQAGYDALRIVEACYASSRKGARVEIDWTR
jgi:predicted dehydrogenase